MSPSSSSMQGGAAEDRQPLRALPPSAAAVDGSGSEGQQPLALDSEAEAALPPPLPPAPPPPSAASARRRTTVLINLSAIMERVDEQLLPALYSRVGRSFHADPEKLGTLTFARAVVQALASPLAGLLGQHANRVHVIAAGAALWGACCLGFATVHSVGQGLPFWALNGVGLALLIPTAQSMTADYNTSRHRGRAFGWLHLTGAVGALIGALFATNIGHARPFGVEGWRAAFAAVAAASWLIGALTLAYAADPRTVEGYEEASAAAASRHHLSWRSALQEAAAVLRVPSFLIIVAQGIVGTTPWLALVFLTLQLQLLGQSDLSASLLMACFLATNAAGGLLGGTLGDWAARRWPNHGRVAVCQVSVGLGVPLSVLLFKGLPLSAAPGATALYALVLSITGLTITWADSACNNPVFSEIVPPHLRNLVYSFDRSFEGAAAACAAPLVGWLARVAFAFEGTAEVGPDPAANLAKARSLSSALLVFTAAPWTLCCLLFSPLHWTYPRDRRRAEEAAAAEAAEAAAAEALLAAVRRAAAAADIELVTTGRGSAGSIEDKVEAAVAAEDSAAEVV